MTAREQLPGSPISRMAMGLVDGEKHRDICPFCGGGAEKEKSFSVERDGQKGRYICFRASCGVRGYIKYGGAPVQHNNNSSGQSRRYAGECTKVQVRVYQYLKQRFKLQPAVLKMYGAKQTHDGRLLLPVLDPAGRSRGDNVLFYKELSTSTHGTMFPKSSLFMDFGHPAMSWHRMGMVEVLEGVYERHTLTIPNFFNGTLIIVEDQISAIKASRLTDAVCLLGTNFSDDKIAEVGRQSAEYDRILLLLDEDAYGKSLALYRRARAVLQGLSVRRLTKDVKDMRYEELFELLKEK